MPRPAARVGLVLRLAALAGPVLILAGSLLLGGCAGLPPRGDAPPSQAFTDTADTALARLAEVSRPAPGSPGADAPSGFQLLPAGEFAFGARIALARRAQRALDLQLYHLQPDRSGRALLRELRAAADRGVRVRLLVDDFHAGDVAPLLHDLAAHPQVQVRLFNPLPLRRGAPLLRLLLSPGDFEQHNRRMHNKLFVADNAVALYGGRNVADAYFMGDAEANFIDLDVLSTGAIVPALSAVFDRYWASDTAWPIAAVLGAPAPAAEALARFDAAVRGNDPPAPAYRRDPLGQDAVEAQLQAGRLVLHPAHAQVFADPPDKASDPAPASQPTAAMRGLLQALAGARQEVVIVSPYFVPGAVGMPMLREAARHGVRTVLFTNSLASTDEPLVHLHYSRYRVEMVQLGVQLHEFNPALVRQSQHFGAFGRSTPRLHAKVAIVDRRQVLVGSVNLDARSAIANTELGVAIDSPALAAQLAQLSGGAPGASVLRVQLQADGRSLAWASADGHGPATRTDEPGSGAWLQFRLWLQSLVVDERRL